MSQVCITPFATDAGVLKRGAFVNDDDPRIQGREAFFVSADEWGDMQNRSGVIEAATARPGEKRALRERAAERQEGFDRQARVEYARSLGLKVRANINADDLEQRIAEAEAAAEADRIQAELDAEAEAAAEAAEADANSVTDDDPTAASMEADTTNTDD